MTRLEEAVAFATEAHAGQVRKITNAPYIVHPLEVAEIIKSITDNEDVIIAGLLHDTIEDCDVDPRVIKEKFGPRVSALVQGESEDKLSDLPPAQTWKQRKEESLLMLEYTKDPDVKILWMGDKLSNIRSFYQGYLEYGDDLWNFFNQKDPREHKWYYETIGKYLIDLKSLS